ncbi:MAG: hypothetical protein FH758_04460 [Firmicutes bacterium]|nr:hypothetical protein [Bacillota bacterium]
MDEKLNQPVQQPELKNVPTQGEAKAVATSEGASATVNQVIVQYRTAVLVLGSDQPALNFNALGKKVDIEMDEQGNMVINGKQVKTKEIGDGIKMVVVEDQDVQENVETTDTKEE